MLMTASAIATSPSSAEMSLTRSGVRSGNCRAAFHRRAGGEVTAIMVRLGGREPEHVADPAEGVQQVRLGGVDLAPQHGDVRLHDAGITAAVVVPDMVEDLHLGQHPVRVAHEVPEQILDHVWDYDFRGDTGI